MISPPRITRSQYRHRSTGGDGSITGPTQIGGTGLSNLAALETHPTSDTLYAADGGQVYTLNATSSANRKKHPAPMLMLISTQLGVYRCHAEGR